MIILLKLFDIFTLMVVGKTKTPASFNCNQKPVGSNFKISLSKCSVKYILMYFIVEI